MESKALVSWGGSGRWGGDADEDEVAFLGVENILKSAWSDGYEVCEYAENKATVTSNG